VTPFSGHETHGFELPFRIPEPDVLGFEEEDDDKPTIIVIFDKPSLQGDAGVVDEKGLPERGGQSAETDGNTDVARISNGTTKPAGTGENADGDGTNNDDKSETTTGSFRIDTGNSLLDLLEVKDASGPWINVTTGVTTVHGVISDLVVTNTDGVFTWSYTLPDDLEHPLHGETGANDSLQDIENFAVRVTDDSGDVSSEAKLGIDA
jgi:hypothetical protein